MTTAVNGPSTRFPQEKAILSVASIGMAVVFGPLVVRRVVHWLVTGQ